MNQKTKTIAGFPGAGSSARSGRSAATGVTQGMTCEEFEAVLAETLNRCDLPTAALQHLAVCRACATMVADFETIAESARQLPPLDSEPASDLWTPIRETLLREGVIHSSELECNNSDQTPAPKLVQRTSLPRR